MNKKEFVGQIGYAVYITSILLLFFLAVLEFFRPGFVVRIFNPLYLIILIFTGGGLSILSQKRKSFLETFLIILLGIGTIIMLWKYIAPLEGKLEIAIFAALIFAVITVFWNITN